MRTVVVATYWATTARPRISYIFIIALLLTLFEGALLYIICIAIPTIHGTRNF